MNISLDTLVEAKNQFISRRSGGFTQTLMVSFVLVDDYKAIDKAIELKLDSVKVNVVVMKGFNEDELCDFVEFVKERRIEVRFIEFMPFDSNDWNNKKLLPYLEIRNLIQEKYNLIRNNDPVTATSKVIIILLIL